ncbi:MAG TPA: class I SAM-dependent methyltransferase [Kofleriaceae bacterium]|nr:class I SAM-dependent methyltransferase [Kofleriaceae bacterium]
MMQSRLWIGWLAAASAIVASGCRSGEEAGDERAALAAALPVEAQAQPAQREPDVVFVPTPEPVVKEMLRMAGVGPNDVVYDLGSGDGRIVIAAARDFGARAVGIDIDPERIKEARENVRRAGVQDKVEIRQGDLFETDLSEADVVTLYLLERLNLKLRPKLLRELRPGARVVSQTFSMGNWKPDAQTEVDGTTIYMWVIPQRKK